MLRRAGSTLWEITKWVLPILLIIAIAWGAEYYYMGSAHITSSVDGKLVPGAEIYKDGVLIGKTPLDYRFGFGAATIEIHAPVGAEGLANCTVHTFVQADSCNAEFATSAPLLKMVQEVQRSLVNVAAPIVTCDPATDYCGYDAKNRTRCISPTDCDGDGVGDSVDEDPCHCTVRDLRGGVPPMH